MINVAGAQTVTYRSGTNTINSLSVLGDDMLAVTGGSLTVANSFSAAAATSVCAGTLTLNGVSSMQSLALSGGTLGGTGELTIAAPSSWLAGTQTGTGTTRYDGATCRSPAPATSSCPWGAPSTLNGTTTWSGNTAANNNALQFAGGTLNNTGTFNDQNAFASFIDHVSGTNAFNNIGTYNKTGEHRHLGRGVLQQHRHDQRQRRDDADAGQPSTSTGIFNIAAGATLEFRNGSHTLDNATIQGAGHLRRQHRERRRRRRRDAERRHAHLAVPVQRQHDHRHRPHLPGHGDVDRRRRSPARRSRRSPTT